MKYIIYVDYRIGCGNHEYRPTQAKSFREALEEAEKIYNADTVYLIRILEKTGKAYKEDDVKCQNYRAIECKRSHEVGWHANTEANSEYDHWARRCFVKLRNKSTIEFFEGLSPFHSSVRV